MLLFFKIFLDGIRGYKSTTLIYRSNVSPYLTDSSLRNIIYRIHKIPILYKRSSNYLSIIQLGIIQCDYKNQQDFKFNYYYYNLLSII